MDDTAYRTPVREGKSQDPDINYERQHHVDCVTANLVKYLLEDKMTVKIYGNQELQKKGNGGGKVKQAQNDSNASFSSVGASKPTQNSTAEAVDSSWMSNQS